MFGKYKTGLYIGAVYIGGIMGAGFATGQELVRYFVRFGIWGLWGIILCGALFAIVGYKVLAFMHTRELTGYREFLTCVMGRKAGKAAEAVSFCFIIALYSSMLAATGSLAESWLGLNRLWGIFLLLALCSLLVLGGAKSLGIFNLLLCPLLMGGSIYMGLRLYFGGIQTFAVFKGLGDNVFGSVLIYVSYNIISGVSLLCALSGQIRSIRDVVSGAVLGGVGLAVAGLALALPLYGYYDIIKGVELPVFTLIKQSGGVMTLCYALLLFAAVLTTAAGCCYSAVDNLMPQSGRERLIYVILVGFAAFLLSLMGFSNIVGRLYYIFGIIGLAELSLIINLRL